jgi:hypothetical protein
MKMAALPRLGLLALLTLAMTEAVTVDWQWRTGARASWYGNGDWPLDIGGCNYGYLWPNEGTGLDVAGKIGWEQQTSPLALRQLSGRDQDRMAAPLAALVAGDRTLTLASVTACLSC